MSYLKNILINAFSNWANLLVTLVLSFFLAPFILHRIGNDYYGIWVLITQTTGYLWLLDFGVRESVVKYVAEYSEKKDYELLNKIISSSVKIYFIIAVICVVFSAILCVIFPIIFKVGQEHIKVAQLVVITTGFDIAQAFFFNAFVGIVMGLQRYDIFSKINIVLAIIKAGVTIIFLNMGYGIVALATIQLTIDICTNCIIYFVAKKLLPFKITIFKRDQNGKEVRKLIFTYSFFVLINNICVQAIFYSSNFIIAIFMPVSSVTYFAIALNLIEYMKKLIFTGTQVFTPLTSQLDAKKESHNISILLVKGSKFSLMLGLPIAVVYCFLGKKFIGLWMGPIYAELSGTILIIMALTTIFSIPHYTIQGILFGLNKHKIIAYCRSIEAITNIGLSIILIKRYGLIGAAIGAAFPHLLVVIFVLPVLITKLLKLDLINYIKSGYIGPILSAIPFAFCCLFVQKIYDPNSLVFFFVEVAILMPIYFLGIWWIALTKEEKQFTKEKILGKILFSGSL